MAKSKEAPGSDNLGDPPLKKRALSNDGLPPAALGCPPGNASLGAAGDASGNASVGQGLVPDPTASIIMNAGPPPDPVSNSSILPIPAYCLPSGSTSGASLPLPTTNSAVIPPASISHVIAGSHNNQPTATIPTTSGYSAFRAGLTTAHQGTYVNNAFSTTYPPASGSTTLPCTVAHNNNNNFNNSSSDTASLLWQHIGSTRKSFSAIDHQFKSVNDSL